MEKTESSKPIKISKPRRKRRWLLVLLGVLGGVILGCALSYWWCNRPIVPTELAAEEQKVLEAKLQSLEQPRYEPGGKLLVLTEREVNALLHSNTDLGDQLKIEFATDAVHARIHTELDADLPVVGGRELKARARFKLTDKESSPAIVLDDLTVWGLSLPNAWLADVKGKNLLDQLGLEKSRLSDGIEEITVRDGEVIIYLAE